MIILYFTIIIIAVHARIGETTLGTSTSSTINNYNTDFATCICNLKSSVCDIFCCCDSDCSSAKIIQWQTASICSTSNLITQNLYNYCQSTAASDLKNFQNINCIYYDNKNKIGKYYPDPTSLTSSTDKQIYEITTSMSPLTLGFISSTSYVLNSPILLSNASQLLISKSVGSGYCHDQPLLIGKNLSYMCLKQLTNSACTAFNPTLSSTVCSLGDCSANITITSNLNSTVASNSSGVCINMIDSISISIGLSGLNFYSITYLTIAATFKNNITIPSSGMTAKVPLTVNVQTYFNNSNVIWRSGAPGYIVGRPVLFASSSNNVFVPININFAISSSNGACLSSSSSSSINLNFLQPINIFCNIIQCNNTKKLLNNIFSNSSQPYAIAKYGDNTVNLSKNDYVIISYAQRNTNSCLPYKTILNIFYSTSGTSYQPQNYIVSAQVTYQQFSSTNVSLLSSIGVQWYYVNPSTVSSPPNNNFYKYFSTLWNPINNLYNTISKWQQYLLLINFILVGCLILI